MDSIAEIECGQCKTIKPVGEFYVRSGIKNPQIRGDYYTYCKKCQNARSKTQVRVPKTVPAVESEILAIDYLKRNGVPTLPGKAVAAADVDLAAYGVVWIEAKHSKKDRNGFIFSTSSAQQSRGFLADIVLLICEYAPDDITFHFLPANHPAFYNKHGKLKQGISFVPGRTEDAKHGIRNAWRTVLTQQMMDSAQDATWLIKDALSQIERKLMAGETLPFELSRRAS
jgi:hypothetical protein